MEEWKKIRSDSDIQELMDLYNGFHDSCIVSVSYQSGAYVDDESTMGFGESADYQLRVVFQSQWNPKEIELCFSGLRQLHLTGWQDHYICCIFSAYLSFCDGVLPGKPEKVIVWADNDTFDINHIDYAIEEPSGTYIIANTLHWRVREKEL